MIWYTVWKTLYCLLSQSCTRMITAYSTVLCKPQSFHSHSISASAPDYVTYLLCVRSRSCVWAVSSMIWRRTSCTLSCVTTRVVMRWMEAQLRHWRRAETRSHTALIGNLDLHSNLNINPNPYTNRNSNRNLNFNLTSNHYPNPNQPRWRVYDN